VQPQGARGVLASLWPAAGASTGELMQILYRLRRERPELAKAQALQQAQLALPGSAVPAAPSWWALLRTTTGSAPPALITVMRIRTTGRRSF
jgi:CHAT domain-containing protein